MSRYSHDMSKETVPKRKKLLPEGWRQFTILDCKETTSKAGNEMFVFTIRDTETGYEEDIYAVATPKKRWFLKTILSAVGCEGGEDGVYNWDIPQVINKEFQGLVEHERNDYINRDGETVKGVQHRITEVKSVEDVSWGDQE